MSLPAVIDLAIPVLPEDSRDDRKMAGAAGLEATVERAIAPYPEILGVHVRAASCNGRLFAGLPFCIARATGSGLDPTGLPPDVLRALYSGATSRHLKAPPGLPGDEEANLLIGRGWTIFEVDVALARDPVAAEAAALIEARRVHGFASPDEAWWHACARLLPSATAHERLARLGRLRADLPDIARWLEREAHFAGSDACFRLHVRPASSDHLDPNL